jgi:farnesyl-diphosphate farnesyltransferase
VVLAEILDRQQKEYLDSYMKHVSRSFSLVAMEVEDPLDNYLATAYLICRVVDNIEDTLQPFEWRQARFAEFTTLLANPTTVEQTLSVWEKMEWPGLTDFERELMTQTDGLPLWQIYTQIPQEYRRSIQRWASEMAFGMERSDNPSSSDYFFDHGPIRLPVQASDYDLYCFYVAGTVGRMITEMAILFYEVDDQTAKMLVEGSDACGRALQKTNIVKDFAQDLQRGMCFLPGEWMQEVDYAPLALKEVPSDWKAKVILNVVGELENSAQYVLALPERAVGYRRAGLLMMIPAYETILLAAQRLPDLFTPNHSVKISRTKMAQSVLRARSMAADNPAIRAYSEEMAKKIRSELGVKLTQV